MSLYPITQLKNGEDFSITKKYFDWLKNERWTAGYTNMLAGGYDGQTLPNDEMGMLWVLLSAATEDIGSKIYSKIKNLSVNLHDIDICEIRGLAAHAQLFDVKDSINFLTYNYPQEIYDLINIFSIERSNLFNNDSVLLSSKIQDLVENTSVSLSSVINSITSGLVASGNPMQHYVYDTLAYSSEDWNYITSLSSNISAYAAINDEQYLALVEDTFVKCLSANVFKRYRPDEIDNNSNYIWQEISSQLEFTSLFNDVNSSDSDIMKLKISLDVDIDFPEVKIVNEIESGKDSLFNYTTREKLVLQAEIKRRRKPSASNSLTKYSYTRENDVKEYFRFLTNFNPDIIESEFDSYDIDSLNQLVLVSDTDTQIITNTEPPTIDTRFIYSAAKYLTNICIKTSYFRNLLRNTAVKYAYAGTNLLIRKIIVDYLRKYVYDQTTNWRFNDGISGEFNNISAVAPTDLLVKIIEYWDSTEYFNISALNNTQYANILDSSATTTLNQPYWLTIEDTNQAFTDDELLSFYKRLGLNLNVSTADENTDVEISKLYDFLEAIYDSAAPSAYKTDTKSSLDNRLMDSFSRMRVFAPSSSFFYNWSASGNFDYVDNYILPPTTSANYDTITADATFTVLSSFINQYQLEVSGLKVAETKYVDTAIEIVNDVVEDFGQYITDNPSANTILENYKNSVREQLQTEASSYFQYVYLPTTEISTITPYTFDGIISHITFFNADGINAMSAIASGQISDISGNLSAYTFNMSGNIDQTTYSVDDFQTVFNKYIGNKYGQNPAVNYKNQVHPSYMLHPYLKSFVTNAFSLTDFTRLVAIIYETDEETMSKVSERVSANGSLINSWKYDNREWTGYSTYYEENPKIDIDNNEQKRLAVDGPWYYPALNDYLTNPSSFINSISAGTNEYYTDLNLTSEELLTIASAYWSIAGTSLDISAMKSSNIYKYAVDDFGNNYILFKDYREFETSGKMWLRFANHPLALPATAIMKNTDHTTIDNAFDNAYDFDINENYMWCLYGHPISGSIAIGLIQRSGFNIDIQNDDIKQFETFDLSGTGYRYGGTYFSYNDDETSFYIVNVATSGQSNYNGLTYNSILSSYTLPIKYSIYNPEYGDKYYYETKYVDLDESSALTDTSKVKNIYRVSKNTETGAVSIAFESKKPNTATKQWFNTFGYNPSANYEDLYVDTSAKVNLPENSITILTGKEIKSLGPYVFGLNIHNTDYVYPFSDLGYVGVFSTNPSGSIHHFTSDKFAALETSGLLEFHPQLFSNTFPCSALNERAYMTFETSSAPLFSLYTTINLGIPVIALETVNNIGISDELLLMSSINDYGYINADDTELSSVYDNNDTVVYTYKIDYLGRNKLKVKQIYSNMLFTEDSIHTGSAYGFSTESNELIICE